MNAKVFRDFDQAGLDFEYNNRQRVPEFEQLYESWVALDLNNRDFYIIPNGYTFSRLPCQYEHNDLSSR